MSEGSIVIYVQSLASQIGFVLANSSSVGKGPSRIQNHDRQGVALCRSATCCSRYFVSLKRRSPIIAYYGCFACRVSSLDRIRSMQNWVRSADLVGAIRVRAVGRRMRRLFVQIGFVSSNHRNCSAAERIASQSGAGYTPSQRSSAVRQVRAIPAGTGVR